jgi:hypothetical protein
VVLFVRANLHVGLNAVLSFVMQLGNRRRHFALVIVQRRNQDAGLLRVGAMHGLAVVPQRRLGESFRVSARLGTFRPGVAAGMERDALNAKELTAAIKLG